MKPAAFSFRAPRELEGVLAEMAEHGEDARILAGGQSLVPLMNLRMLQPAVLVSINDCAELAYVREEQDDVVIGAAARQWEVEHDPAVLRHCPLLAEALQYVGGRSNRNRGTVCGSLAHADPLAELPTVALALGATMVVNGASGRRSVPAGGFFVGALENCLAPGEMLEAVRFPKDADGRRSCFLESGNRKHGFALAGVAVSLELDDEGRCRRPRVAVMGGESIARRLEEVEASLEGARPVPALLREVGRLAEGGVEMVGDFHADRAYRAHLVGVLLQRAISRAAGMPVQA